MNPRLRNARALVDSGAVTVDGDLVVVQVDDHVQHVRLSPDGATCTCQWWAKYARQPWSVQARARRPDRRRREGWCGAFRAYAGKVAVTAAADALTRAALAGDLGRVRDLLRDLDETQRRALRPELKSVTTELRRTGRLWEHLRSYDALGLATLGCTAGAATTATHIAKWWKWGPTRDAPLVDVLLDRDPAWLPELLDRLAGGALENDIWNGHWHVVEDLRSRLGAPRPRTPAYLRGLVADLTLDYRKTTDPVRRPLLAELCADEELVGMVPLMLELADVPGLAAEWISVFDPQSRRQEVVQRAPDDTWPGVVRALCEQGRLDRGAAIDACLRILLRTEAKGATPPHLTILASLEATPQEVASRRSYVQLAGDGTGPCAKHAQRALRAAWDAGLIDTETMLDASRMVLARPEKGLVTTQLAWLDRMAKGAGDAPDDVLLVVADAFGHERTDVQERALAVVGKHIGRASPATVAELVAAAAALAPSLRGRAGEVLGTSLEPAGDDGGSVPVGPGGAGRVLADAARAPWACWPRPARRSSNGWTTRRCWSRCSRGSPACATRTARHSTRPWPRCVTGSPRTR